MFLLLKNSAGFLSQYNCGSSVRLSPRSIVGGEEKQKPEIMAIDATGIDLWQLSRHYAWRIGEPYFPHAKLDALIDVKDSVILGLMCTLF